MMVTTIRGKFADVEGSITLDEDFGLTWNVALESGGWLVGKDIKLELDLAVELAKPAAGTAHGIADAAA